VIETFTPVTKSLTPISCLALSKTKAMSQGGASLQRTLFAGSWDKCIYSWILLTDGSGNVGKITRGPILRGHVDFVKALQCAQIGNEKDILISGSADSTIIIWDVKIGQRLHTLKGHSRGVQALAIDYNFSNKESTTFFSGDSNREIRCWKVTEKEAIEISIDEDAQTLKPLIAHETSIFAMVLERQTSEGNLWTASADKTAKRLKRSRKFEAVETFEHPDFVKDIAIDEEQGYAITACRDEEVRLWDMETGKLYHTFSGHYDEVTGVCIVQSYAYGAEGYWAVSVSIDGTVRQWGLQSDQLKKAIADAKKAKEEEVKAEPEPKKSLLTEEEERELAELMEDNE
jgi:WD40 repeat protein